MCGIDYDLIENLQNVFKSVKNEELTVDQGVGEVIGLCGNISKEDWETIGLSNGWFE